MRLGTKSFTESKAERRTPERAQSSEAQVLTLEEVKKDAVSSASSKEWQEIIVTFDSGASDTVMPLQMCEGIAVQPSPQSLRGTEYEVANGETIPNVGERRCTVMTEGSQLPKLMNFQICDVHKALLSASKVCDMNYRCILTKTGGQLEDMETGDVIPLHRNGNLYFMRVWVREADFARQG